jgi:hypothetical protein
MGLRLDKVSIFGNEFYVSNPGLLPFCLWTTYFYYLIRYYQYFHDIQDRGVKEKYNSYLKYLLYAMIETKVKDRFIKGQQSKKNAKYEFDKPEYVDSTLDAWAAMVHVKMPVSIKIESVNDNSLSINTTSTFAESTEFAFRKDFLRFRLQAFLHVCFRTSLITEYYLPFLVASLPCFWWLFKDIA